MLSFFPRGVLDEILNLIESVSEEFPSYSSLFALVVFSSLLSEYCLPTVSVWPVFVFTVLRRAVFGMPDILGDVEK